MRYSAFAMCGFSFCLLSCAVWAQEATTRPAVPGSSLTNLDVTATPPERIKAPEGFKVELLYTVPKGDQGSWVSMCVDPRGRLIVSDQYGSLYRVTVPPPGESGPPKIEKIDVDLGQAHGLLWAFDSLYVVVNSNGEKFASGLYRVRDTNGDDQLDSVELLKRFVGGGGEHGPHVAIPTPDGKSLFIVCGNQTAPVKDVDSRVPQVWDEDMLLPRIYGVGFMRGATPPAGCIYRTDPDGKHWELISSGFRNQFDAAVNADGELFTYDADMEWDVGAPWYRPTRVCHVVSGSDWGWRVCSAKWPVHYPETVPPVVDIGLGSPTGITFGYGAKFPAKYQNALFLNDWTYGKMYAVFMEPDGASYRGTAEEFLMASPLPLTDTVINPHDGAMYFLIGGRNTQSGLYRVTYAGNEPTTPAIAKSPATEVRALRAKLEALHLGDHANAADEAWPHLGHPDRFVRHAARTAIEQRPLETWQKRALAERDPEAAISALLALVRKVPRSYKPESAMNLDTPPPSYPATGAERHPLEPEVLAALDRLEWASLTQSQRLALLRVYALALYRLGPPDEATRARLIARLDGIYPADDRETNVAITELLCYLQAPSAAEKGVALLLAAPTQEGQLDLVRSLRFLEAGWNDQLHREFFGWFNRAAAYHGGNNFRMFVEELKKDAVDRVPKDQLAALDDVINAPVPKEVTPLSAKPRPFVKEWKMEEIVPLLSSDLTKRDFDHGREMFAATNCYGCHRFAGEGGAVGPDLTGLAGRFSPRDILESVLEPDKVISDQYATTVVQTADGRTIVGRIVNFSGEDIHINTDLLNPMAVETVKRQNIDELSTGTVSMMPHGLLNSLNEDELLDLMAFLLSRGDRNEKMFAE